MSDLKAELSELLARRDKIGAIRLLREHTGLGLADAKAAVERFESEGVLPDSGTASATEELPPDVRELVAQGNTIEAIKLLRERLGLDLAEAKRRIDRVGGKAARSGCAALLLGLVLVGSSLWCAGSFHPFA